MASGDSADSLSVLMAASVALGYRRVWAASPVGADLRRTGPR
ncbi:hypothetical protein MMMB2_1913 [Mycobacterium marinum MB2]|nr:hypothetical protein MMSP_2717 [Mycobacterium sp. 012931]EPQ77251.1 hypothetical protein MMMB2_1913 [Mycobacterium marinum MB2]